MGARAVSAVRFTTGSCHWVFDVRLETGASAVLRMTTASLRPAMCGALHLNELLRPPGVPLPRVLETDLDAAFPTLVLERLAGIDLAHVMARACCGSVWSVACMAGPALGVAGGDGCEGVGKGASEGVAGSDRFGAQVCFQLGPGLLDGVPVRGWAGR